MLESGLRGGVVGLALRGAQRARKQASQSSSEEVEEARQLLLPNEDVVRRLRRQPRGESRTRVARLYDRALEAASASRSTTRPTRRTPTMRVSISTRVEAPRYFPCTTNAGCIYGFNCEEARARAQRHWPAVPDGLFYAASTWLSTVERGVRRGDDAAPEAGGGGGGVARAERPRGKPDRRARPRDDLVLRWLKRRRPSSHAFYFEMTNVVRRHLLGPKLLGGGVTLLAVEERISHRRRAPSSSPTTSTASARRGRRCAKADARRRRRAARCTLDAHRAYRSRRGA